MPARKPYKVEIDVVPYLSIMAIVLKLIMLILIIQVCRIALNPQSLKVLRYSMLYRVQEEALKGKGGVLVQKVPVYFDCHPDHIEIQPNDLKVPVGDLRDPQGDFAAVMRSLQETDAHGNLLRYAILIVRPRSEQVYRFMRRQVAARKLPVGYDVLEAGYVIDWEAEKVRALMKKVPTKKAPEGEGASAESAGRDASPREKAAAAH